MQVIQVSATRDGYVITRKATNADSARTSECRSSEQLRFILRSLALSDRKVAHIFKQLETAEHAELKL